MINALLQMVPTLTAAMSASTPSQEAARIAGMTSTDLRICWLKARESKWLCSLSEPSVMLLMSAQMIESPE